MATKTTKPAGSSAADRATRVAAALNEAISKPRSTGRKSAAAAAADLQALILRREELQAAAKAIYAECDDLDVQIFAALPVGERFILEDGRAAQVVNNFIDKNGMPRNVSYKPCGVRLYELKIK